MTKKQKDEATEAVGEMIADSALALGKKSRKEIDRIVEIYRNLLTIKAAALRMGPKYGAAHVARCIGFVRSELTEADITFGATVLQDEPSASATKPAGGERPGAGNEPHGPAQLEKQHKKPR
jgi:hypothetical protein